MSSRYVWETVPKRNASQLSMLEFVRMMEKAGLAKWADDDLAWFEDHRQSHNFQAQYLDKLTRFRADLYTHEKSNMDNTMGRLRKLNNESKTTSPNKKSRKPTRSDSGDEMLTLTHDMNPARHIQLQQLKRERIQKQKRPKTPPKLDPLEGKQLIEPIKEARECKSAPDNKEKTVVNIESRVIASSESLPNLSPRHSGHPSESRTRAITELQKLLHPSSSIPNVGRRAVTEPDRLIPLQLDARQSPDRSKNTFIKQMSMYKKHPRTKLYQGTLYKTSHSQNLDQLELSPESYNYHFRSSLDSLLDKVARAQNTHSLYAPATTPVCSDDEEMLKNNRNVDYETHLPAVANLVKYRLRKDDKRITKPEFVSYVKKRRNEKTCSKCLHRNKGFEAREKFMDEMSSACHKCDEMSLPKFKQNDLQSQSFLTIQTKTATDPTTKHNILDSPNSSLGSSNSSSDSESTPKRKIIVQMPDIVLKPCSPMDNLKTGKLYRSIRQNEYRKKEVKNLLEDVREINEKTEQLTQYIKKEESSVT